MMAFASMSDATLGERRKISISIALLALASASVAAPLLLIFAVLDGAPVPTAPGIVLLGFVSFAIHFLATFFALSTLYAVFGAVSTRMRERLLRNGRRMSVGKLLELGSARLSLTLFDDIAGTESAATKLVAQWLSKVGLLVLIAMLLTLLSGWLLAAVVVVLTLTFWINRWAQTRIDRLVARRNADIHQLSVRIEDYVGGIATLRAFGRTAQAAEQFRSAVEASRALLAKSAPGIIAFGALTRLYVDVAFCSVMGLSAVMFLNDRLSLGGFLASCVGLLWMSQLWTSILDDGFKLTALRAAGKRIEAIGGLEPLKIFTELPRDANECASSVTCANVKFSYDNRRVLDDVTLSFPPNSVTAIVGRSGTGKTTLLNLIMRFWDVDGGAIKVGGDDVRSLELSALYAKVSPVFQSPHIFRDTLVDNVRLGSAARVQAALVRANCGDIVDRFPSPLIFGVDADLSGGERQRLAIARAFLKDAPVILLDEPTSALDAGNERKLQQALAETARDRTLIVISHRLPMIASADRIIVMSEGKIEAVGCHETLLESSPTYAALWKASETVSAWEFS